MRAVFRLALGERLFLAVVGVGKVVDSGQQRSEHLAIVDDAADGSAAETDAMVATLAATVRLSRQGRANTLDAMKPSGAARCRHIMRLPPDPSTALAILH